MYRVGSASDRVLSRISALDEARKVAEAELARIELLPKEPNSTEDGTNSIFFKIKFKNSGSYYSYVATYIDAMGVWYVSGPYQRNNGGYTWDRLVGWITNSIEWEIWHVTNYELLAKSD